MSTIRLLTISILCFTTAFCIVAFAFKDSFSEEHYYTNADLEKYKYPTENKAEEKVYTNEDLVSYKATAGTPVPYKPIEDIPYKPIVTNNVRDVKPTNDELYKDSIHDRVTALQVRFCRRNNVGGKSWISCGHKLRLDGQPLTGYKLSRRGKYWQR